MSTQIDLLKKYGLPIRGISGQHLLIDPNIQQKIVDAVDPKPEDHILEIGPGLGALTGWILQRGSSVIAVEKDSRFVEILKGEYGQDFKGRLEVISKDILDFDLDKLKSRSKNNWKLVSNLPYYITAPILFHVFNYRRMFSKAIFMMQREVAKRILALPGTKDYGRLSVSVRYHADCRHLFDVSPACFTPRPEVQSSVIELDFHPHSSVSLDQERFLFRVIETAFSQRRKTLLGLLSQDEQMKCSREDLKEIFKKIGFSQTLRGEELLLKDYLKLTEALLNTP